jgi:hypothetical protein
MRAAILRAALIELVIIAVGIFLYLKLGSIAPFIIAMVVGPGVFLFFVAQAGAFDRRNDQR